MVGRLGDKLIVQGVGSSSGWPAEIERRNAPVGLAIATQNDSYLPTDATSFYLKSVPILSAFTGTHEEYHSPRDTAETLNYDGMVKISRFMALVTRSLLVNEEEPDYLKMEQPAQGSGRARLRAYLGTIPDYAQGDLVGVKLGGVTAGAPAENAGLRGGDVIVELAGRTIENIYDYTYAIEALKIGQPVSVVVMRNGERLTFEIIPGSRE
jgi:C-terminal processing protease CtpA/Prc